MPLATSELVCYSLLLASGILGNTLVLLTIIINTLENKTMPPSDLLLFNLTVILLLLSVFRNILTITFQQGVDISFNSHLCKLFLFLWTLLRSMSIWGTFSLSVFHYISIKNYYIKIRRTALRTTMKALVVIWTFNCLYFFPALLYIDHTKSNLTFTVQLVSATTKPVYGCIWHFPTPQADLLFVTISLVVHEVIPIILMVGTNLSSLHMLQQHSKTIAAQKTIKRVAAERKAALVIFTLVILYVLCWGSNVVASNLYNFTRGSSSLSFVLVIANFGSYIFMGFSPLVLLIGHSKLRRKLVHLICKQWKCQVSPAHYVPKKNNNNVAIVKM